MDRRNVLKGAAAAAALLPANGVLAKGQASRSFPEDFIWGVSTAGHQIEGNDTASDLWFMENISPTPFKEPVGDAANSFHLWETDLDLVAGMGLNAYRFSVEWSRIEPIEGQVSQAHLDHYERIIDGCHARGLQPIITFKHFTAPLWFSQKGGWLNEDAGKYFAEHCSRVSQQMGDRIAYGITLNEPNLPPLLEMLNLPDFVKKKRRDGIMRARELSPTGKFSAANMTLPEEFRTVENNMVAGHAQARAAIKAARSDLPVGVSVAIFDDQVVPGGEKRREDVREFLYSAWIEEAKSDDFFAVQNYERAVWGADGKIPAPEGVDRGFLGAEVYAPSLAGAVRYAHEATGKPILVSEHGVGTPDDSVRARFIPESLVHLHKAIEDGVPVIGYSHWSLIDNFEWNFGYEPTFGLHSFDRKTFERTAKPSAGIYSTIAKSNAV